MSLPVKFQESTGSALPASVGSSLVIPVKFNESTEKLPVQFGEGAGAGVSNYTGDYTVTPKVTAQLLPTKNKRMTDDVTIKKIPFFDVSNEAGGNTVYIGKEI